MNDSSTFAVHIPVPNIPITLKKPVGETGEKQRCLRSLLNESPNRYASPVSDAQPLGQLKKKKNSAIDVKSLEHLSPYLGMVSTLPMKLVTYTFAAFAVDEDPKLDSETEGTSNKASKSKAKKGKNKTIEEDENRGALVCVREGRDEEEEEEEEGRRKEASNTSSGVKADGFPHKMVAMHRVRWNMNKGSERWLCYGGAAGIVRCQEIDPFGLAAMRPRR